MSNWEKLKSLYINNKLKIFPVQENDKKPIIENWGNDCSYDYFQILYWYENCKNCNWGLPATPNNLFILDLDVHDEDKNGIDSFNKLLNDILGYNINIDLFEVCDTLIQKTPSGGLHIIFQSDDDLKNVLNGANVFKDYPGIDIRTDGYVVVEPSIINGKNYSFCNMSSVNKMPDKLKEYILDNTGLKNNIKEEYKKPTHVEVGDRDNQLFSYINNLYYKTRLDQNEILLLANDFNNNILEKPFDEKVVKYKVDKIFKKDRGKYIFVKLSDE